MPKIDSFEEFLRKKNEEQPTKKIDWEKRKSDWLNSVTLLYKEIRSWLDPFINNALLKIAEKEISISEDYIGHYKIKQLDIYLGNDIVSLIPKGTLIIGSLGRIDLRGPKGEIIIVQQKWNDWKIVKRFPKIQTWNLTDSSFQKALQEAING